MHPDLAELLTLRDRAGDSGPVAEHVAGCAVCRAELERLQQLQNTMRAAPDVSGEDRWAAIAARLHEPKAPARAWPRPSWRTAAAVCGALAIAVGLALFNGSTPMPVQPNAGAAATEPNDQAVAALMAESKRLERLLAAIPQESRVARGATVMTTAGLEDRIEWVDLAIGDGAARDPDPAAVAPLWRQRVDLLNSLVAVRYAEARTTTY